MLNVLFLILNCKQFPIYEFVYVITSLSKCTDVGTWIVDTPKEKWFSYDLEQKNAIEDYISLR